MLQHTGNTAHQRSLGPVERMLLAARARLARPEAWTQGALARTASGQEALGYEPGVVCWCVRGALEAVPGTLSDYAAAVQRYEEAVGTRCLEDWNDAPGRTHGEILAGFDRALTLGGRP